MAELLTVLDVENINFSKALRGYSTEEVEDFLERVGESLRSIPRG